MILWRLFGFPNHPTKGTMERVLPLRIDTDAFIVMNTGIVLDANNAFVAEFDTIDEAEAFVAKANGVDVATLRAQTEESAKMRNEYMRNVRRGKTPGGTALT